MESTSLVFYALKGQTDIAWRLEPQETVDYTHLFALKGQDQITGVPSGRKLGMLLFLGFKTPGFILSRLRREKPETT